MAARTTYTHLSTPPVPGGGPTGFVAEYAARVKQLFDASAIPLTAIGGTANAVTATLDPVLDGGGLVDGMKFTLTFGAANTGGMTLAINGGAAIALLDNSGAALLAGAVASGLRALIEYIGGSFRILSEIKVSASGGAGPYSTVITASTTWVKPAGYADDTLVRIQAWGGGGGGGSAGAGVSAGGGGGGGYIERIMRYADVPSSVVVTIGAGGAAGAAGGNTTFGSLVTAYRGGGGGLVGSGGGGELSAGATNANNGGEVGGGSGASAATIWGGGGQVAGLSALGLAVYGGAAGAGKGTSASGIGGAVSLYGGNGGASSGNGAGSAGTAPGGGGGAGVTGGVGARGEVRIQILG